MSSTNTGNWPANTYELLRPDFTGEHAIGWSQQNPETSCQARLPGNLFRRLARIFGAAPSALIRTRQNPGLTAGATLVPALRAWCRGYRLHDSRPRNNDCRPGLNNCRPRIPRIAASKTRYQGSPGREAGVGRGQWIIQI